jgi:cytochrome P450
LTVDGQGYLIPEDTVIVPSMQTAHTYPREWGNDSLEWRPQRWIINQLGSNDLETEAIMTPTPGTYFPWSQGIRICPGKKFIQVEFVAIMAALFYEHRSEPVPLAGESPKEAEARALKVADDTCQGLLHHMRRPEAVSIRWSKKS